MMFHDRTDAAKKLAGLLKGRTFLDPLVLAIPRGGVVTGAVLASALGADFDVVLSRKLRAPYQPEFALGAISESGKVYLSMEAEEYALKLSDYMRQEKSLQMAEINRRRQLIRSVMPQATIQGRTVIVTDDGIATGATIIAALQSVRQQSPHEVIVAVPVAAPARLKEVRRWCDEAVCLFATETLMAVGQFYENFEAVEDEQMMEIIREVSGRAKTPKQTILPSSEVGLSD